MKKLFLLISMAAAMVSFAGCQKNEMNSVDDIKGKASSFELVADIAQTKTTLDGMTVEWEEGDIIYMVTSDETWGKPYADDDGGETIADFVYADGKFTTEATIADSDEPYTFKALYTAESQRSFHRGASSTHKLQGTQTQDCSKPTAHIKDNDALVGTFEATTPMSQPAKVTMAHLYTMMEVMVKNNTEAAMEITKFEMTAAGADLAAVFNITSFGETPTITTKSGQSSTITVNVTGGSVEKGASLPVYFVMAPLAEYSGDVTFKVTDSESNTYTKTVKMNGISFEAGKYNTTPYTVTAADEVITEDYSGEWLITGKVNNKLYAASAYTTGSNNLGTVVEIAVNDDKITEVDGLAACKMEIEKVTEGTYAGMYTIKCSNGMYLYAASSSNNQLKGQTNLTENSYWTITKDVQGVYSIEAEKSSNRKVMQFNTSNKLFSCYASASQSAVTLYPYSMVVPDLTPRIKVSETEKEVLAEGGQVTFSYELLNLEGHTLEVAVSDEDMLSASAADGVITVTVLENNAEAREATVTLTCGEAATVVLVITQLGAPVVDDDLVAGAAYSYTFTKTEFTANGAKTLGNLSWTVAGDGAYWGFDNNKGQQFGSGNKPYKNLTMSTDGYSGGVNKIVINTSGASSINATLTVTVGGVQYGSAVKLTTTATPYTFSAPEAGMQAGEIKLSYAQTSSKAIYIKSISINND